MYEIEIFPVPLKGYILKKDKVVCFHNNENHDYLPIFFINRQGAGLYYLCTNAGTK